MTDGPLDRARSLAGSLRVASRAATAGLPAWWQHRDALADLERVVVFLGTPRSGHSLVGSLLTAHPEAVVSHELDLLGLVARRLPRSVLLGAVLAADRRFAAAGRTWTGYDYRVPDAWQGSYRRLRVVGDKRGSGTTLWLERDPDLLDQLRDRVRVPLRVVHVVRHPVDNAAAIAARQRDGDLTGGVSHLLRLTTTIDAVRRGRLRPDELVELHHDDLTRDPRGQLAALAERLGLSAEPGWLEACASVVHDRPRRRDVTLPAAAATALAARCESTPFLTRYVDDVRAAAG